MIVSAVYSKLLLMCVCVCVCVCVCASACVHMPVFLFLTREDRIPTEEKKVPWTLTLQCLLLLWSWDAPSRHQDFSKGILAPLCSTGKWHLEWSSPCYFPHTLAHTKIPVKSYSTYMDKKKKITLLWKPSTRKDTKMPTDKCLVIGFLFSKSQILS
jgi:hypothetical protein